VTVRGRGAGSSSCARPRGAAPFPGRREYSIPLGVAEGVLIEVPETAQPPSAGSEWFEDEAAASRRHAELSADAAALDAAAFRSRYRLP
jgi:hypothetical protein